MALGPHAFFLVAGGRAAAPPGCALGESTLPGWTRCTWARALALREAAPARAPALAASVAGCEDATLAVQDAAQLPFLAVQDAEPLPTPALAVQDAAQLPFLAVQDAEPLPTLALALRDAAQLPSLAVQDATDAAPLPAQHPVLPQVARLAVLAMLEDHPIRK